MLNFDKISFRYQPNNWLFSNLDLHLEAGKICGLLGKNGAGKSTFLKLISGLLFPTMGKCEVLNYEPYERHVDFLANIYYVAEEFWLPDITIEKYVKLFAPFYPQFSHESFKKNLQEFGVNLKDNLHAISYGQKKKFLLAFAFATNCKILLLDEPTNGLDIPGKSQFRKLAIANFDEQKTFIIATHQVHDLEALIDTVVMLDQGKIIFQQTMEDIAKTLYFTEESTADNTAIYQEKTFSGYRVLQPNQTGSESQVNLELLFQAVLSNAEKINTCFSRRTI